MSTLTRIRLTQPWKLISSRRTLLGSIVFPHHWEQIGYPLRCFRFHMRPASLFQIAESKEIVHARTGEIIWVNHPVFGQVVMLNGLTIEEFELIPNCSFHPSAGYLRTLVE